MVIGTAITSAPFQTNTASYCCCCWCLFTIVIDINCDLWAWIVVRVLIVIAVCVCVYFVVLCDSNAFISTTLCCPEQVLYATAHALTQRWLFIYTKWLMICIRLAQNTFNAFWETMFFHYTICLLSSDSYWQWMFCLKTCRKGLRLSTLLLFFIDMRCKYTIYTVQRSIKPLKPSFYVLFDLILRFTLCVNAYQEKVFLKKEAQITILCSI